MPLLWAVMVEQTGCNTVVKTTENKSYTSQTCYCSTLHNLYLCCKKPVIITFFFEEKKLLGATF